MGLCTSQESRDFIWCNNGHVPAECVLMDQERFHGHHARKTVKRYWCHVCQMVKEQTFYSVDFTHDQEKCSSFVLRQKEQQPNWLNPMGRSSSLVSTQPVDTS